MDSPVIAPIALWSSAKPTFRISSICVTPDFQNLVTGSYEGQLCVWDLNIKKKEIIPKIVLFGHEYSVTCLVSTNEFMVSSCEGGKICRWNLEDGYCERAKNSKYIHRNIQLLRRTPSKDEFLFTCGDYSYILIYHSVSLQVICKLISKADSNWISNFHVVPVLNEDTIEVSGITAVGCMKSWVIDNNLNKSQSEIHAHNLPVEKVVDFKYNSTKTMILIVTVSYWCIFDSEHFHCKHKIQSVNNEKLLGGNYCNLNVIVWTASGKFYSYNEKNNEQQLIATLLDDSFQISLYRPAMALMESNCDETYFFRGDTEGQITIWSRKEEFNSSFVQPLLQAKLNDKWIGSENDFFDNIIKFSSVTSSLYVLELDRFFLGCLNGKIISMPAMQALMSFYFCSSVEKPVYDILPGHTGKINCLLYPYSKYKHYDKSHLVSGGKDFTVCLWDIFKLELIHKFCVQSGEILQLIVPPNKCNYHVKQSVCSVSSDHSVALLNLTDRRCTILTSRHTFPVISVNWKPLDDFLIIECFDGTVYVWETETGLLDRVLSGVVAQEVLYACRESTSHDASLLNFYIVEEVTTKNSMRREIFQMHGDLDITDHPVTLNGFRTSEKSESHTFLCNFEYLIAKIISDQKFKSNGSSGDFKENLYFLTRVSNTEYPRKSSVGAEDKAGKKTEIYSWEQSDLKMKPRKFDVRENGDVDDSDNHFSFLCEKMRKILNFFLSALHFWGVDESVDEILKTNLGLFRPEVNLPVGIFSGRGIFSLFLPTGKMTLRNSSTLIASTSVVMTALSKVFESVSLFSFNFLDPSERTKNREGNAWEELYCFYERMCLNVNKEIIVPSPRIEILAKFWQSKCLPLRKTVRKLLPSHLEALVQEEHVNLLKFWYNYLPHLHVPEGKVDSDNVDLKTIALVLFGTFGSDLKFKTNYPMCQENYLSQTFTTLAYLLLLPDREKHRLTSLQTIAIDFIGRGYIVWEQFLKLENIFPVLFQMCCNTLKHSFDSSSTIPGSSDRCLAAYEALKAIAIARTSAFIKCLINEINQPKSSNQTRGECFLIENSKPEILSILVFLLEKTPYIMLIYLNEVISLCVYCIDFSHLKQGNLTDLIPIMGKFRQVHHTVIGQKIAVGLPTGSIVVHDLKTGRSLTLSAHKDSVSAIKFSEDGKCLASYSCYENRISFWQVFTGIFGLGSVQIKYIKSYRTYQIHDEEIRNHLEIAELNWTGNKSVALCLCDGTETVFQT